MAVTLHNLAAIAYRRGNYRRAETLARRSLRIRKKLLGPDHPELATTLNNLAVIHHALGRHRHAEANYRAALTVLAGKVDENHPTLAAVRAAYEDHQGSRVSESPARQSCVT